MTKHNSTERGMRHMTNNTSHKSKKDDITPKYIEEFDRKLLGKNVSLQNRKEFDDWLTKTIEQEKKKAFREGYKEAAGLDAKILREHQELLSKL